MVQIKYSVIVTTLVIGLSGCSSIPFLSKNEQTDTSTRSQSEGKGYVPNFIKPYRIDIQQGNFITQKEISKLQVGMSKEQVRFTLGTPLLQSAFHENRWDYPYRLTQGNGTVVQATYTLFFENGMLTKHGGDNLPPE